ncbi:hypothetical protein GO755_37795 [Spirosoma sp. HMF4905]|uniref:Uncharacterized protein n=1 Tax=Spirosoma arboris TaxID=2682092 RepID=A0A7K1SPW8_9BACT|nr:DUF6252 family protein [Spirosoma arboris]MVM35831.1 hypothetical protein [Spirosoma arboris]
MKIAQFVSFLAMAALISLSSCSKKSDDSVTPTTTQTQAGFSVKIDGQSYTPDFAYALASSPGTSNYYAIYGLDSKTSDIVAIALPNTVAEGTYTLSNVNFATMTIAKEDFSTVNGGTGTVTIKTKTATNITGTFSFTAYDVTGTKKRVLTDGTFNVGIR